MSSYQCSMEKKYLRRFLFLQTWQKAQFEPYSGHLTSSDAIRNADRGGFIADFDDKVRHLAGYVLKESVDFLFQTALSLSQYPEPEHPSINTVPTPAALRGTPLHPDSVMCSPPFCVERRWALDPGSHAHCREPRFPTHGPHHTYLRGD